MMMIQPGFDDDDGVYEENRDGRKLKRRLFQLLPLETDSLSAKKEINLAIFKNISKLG